MSHTTQTHSQLAIRDISPMSTIPWPHHVSLHLCVTIKSSVSGKRAAEWLMPGSAAERLRGRQSNPGDRLVAVQRPTHTKKDPFNHSHGSYSGQQAWCLQFPRPLLKNDTFSDQMLETARTELWLLAGPCFFCFFVWERRRAIFNQRWKFEYPSTPWAHKPPLPDISGFQHRRRGVFGGHGSPSDQLDSKVPLLATPHLLPPTAHNLQKRTYWWMIEKAGGSARSFERACDCPLGSFVGWQWLPVAFQGAIFPIHSCMFGGAVCSVGCQERHGDDKLGLRVEWGLSKLSSALDLAHRTKVMSAPRNWQESLYVVLALTLNWENDLETKTIML